MDTLGTVAPKPEGLGISEQELDMAGTVVLRGRNRVTSPFQECFDSLGEGHNEDAYGAIERLVQAGEEGGFTVKDLIRMLHGGMSLGSLLDIIEVRMKGSCMHTESSVA